MERVARGRRGARGCGHVPARGGRQLSRSQRRTPEQLAAKLELRAQLTDTAPVMEAAAYFLGARPRSVSETTMRLMRLGYPAALVDEVVTRLVEMGYLNDDEFARAWVDSRDRSRPRGETALRRELALKGVPRSIVDEVLDERRETASGTNADGDAARALLERRRSALERVTDPVKRRQRAYALLARHGFDPETCREVAATLENAE